MAFTFCYGACRITSFILNRVVTSCDKFRFSEREEVYDVKALLARNIGFLYCMIQSCQWNIMSQPYARQASTTFETLAE